MRFPNWFDDWRNHVVGYWARAERIRAAYYAVVADGRIKNDASSS